LAFLRAVHQTQLVSAVAAYSLRDFPHSLPSPIADAVRDIFDRLVSVINKHDAQPGGNERNLLYRRDKLKAGQARNNQNEEIAVLALNLLLAVEPDKGKKKPVSGMEGRQFQMLARHQAVAMLYAHLDSFVGDTLRAICGVKPEVLRGSGKKQLTWESALSFRSIDDLREHLVEQFVYDAGWQSAPEYVAFFEERFKLSFNLPPAVLPLLNLFEQRRHLIIHNGGLVTARYIAKTGDTKTKVGRELAIASDEVRRVGEAIKMFGSELCWAVGVKFFEATPKDLTQIWKFGPPATKTDQET